MVIIYIFTYGTLLKGHSNHHIIELAKGKFIGKAKMYGKSMFYVGGVGSFPVVVHGKGTIYGEVYELPDKIETINIIMNEKQIINPITILDKLEGYNQNRPISMNMYNRKKAKVILENGKKIWVSYYYWNNNIKGLIPIKSGDYRLGVINE